MYNNHDYLNKLYHDHRHRELVRRADHSRLASQLRSGRAVRIRMHRPALAALGRGLVLAGLYLQRKSGALVDKPPRVVQPSARGA